jgi:hypothetical protein
MPPSVAGSAEALENSNYSEGFGQHRITRSLVSVMVMETP